MSIGENDHSIYIKPERRTYSQGEWKSLTIAERSRIINEVHEVYGEIGPEVMQVELAHAIENALKLKNGF